MHKNLSISWSNNKETNKETHKSQKQATKPNQTKPKHSHTQTPTATIHHHSFCLFVIPTFIPMLEGTHSIWPYLMAKFLTLMWNLTNTKYYWFLQNPKYLVRNLATDVPYHLHAKSSWLKGPVAEVILLLISNYSFFTDSKF